MCAHPGAHGFWHRSTPVIGTPVMQSASPARITFFSNTYFLVFCTGSFRLKLNPGARRSSPSPSSWSRTRRGTPACCRCPSRSWARGGRPLPSLSVSVAECRRRGRCLYRDLPYQDLPGASFLDGPFISRSFSSNDKILTRGWADTRNMSKSS